MGEVLVQYLKVSFIRFSQVIAAMKKSLRFNGNTWNQPALKAG
jgi:hypothetical protein